MRKQAEKIRILKATMGNESSHVISNDNRVGVVKMAHSTMIALMMEAVRTSESSVNFNVTTRRYIPEGSKRHSENIYFSHTVTYRIHDNGIWALKQWEDKRKQTHSMTQFIKLEKWKLFQELDMTLTKPNRKPAQNSDKRVSPKRWYLSIQKKMVTSCSKE
jgi:hypothetical protein